VEAEVGGKVNPVDAEGNGDSFDRSHPHARPLVPAAPRRPDGQTLTASVPAGPPDVLHSLIEREEQSETSTALSAQERAGWKTCPTCG